MRINSFLECREFIGDAGGARTPDAEEERGVCCDCGGEGGDRVTVGGGLNVGVETGGGERPGGEVEGLSDAEFEGEVRFGFGGAGGKSRAGVKTLVDFLGEGEGGEEEGGDQDLGKGDVHFREWSL